MTSEKKVVKERKHTCLHMCLVSKQHLLAITVKTMNVNEIGKT